MRSLLTLVVLALTCAPAASPPPAAAPLDPTASDPVAWGARTPTLHEAKPAAHPTTQLVVHLPDHVRDAPWTTRARDTWELDNLETLLVPAAEDWPDDDVAQALHRALCGEVWSCDDLDEEEAWGELADLVDARGLSAHAPGTVGTEWDRYATLWLTYVQSSGFLLTDEDRATLQDGLDATLQTTPDGPLRGALVTAAILMGGDDDRQLERMWELVEEHDDPYAILGMEALLEADIPSDAFDDLHFAPDGTPELLRRRLALERASTDAQTLDAAGRTLLDHPLATPGDLLDVDELHARRSASIPEEPWARALVADAEACADLTAGEDVRLQVRDGTWHTLGEGSAADCLFGWSWPEPVADQDVVLSVVR